MAQESISSIEQLVAAREARGLSAEDMLRQLKLAPRQLRALEEGDWQALPGLAFTRAVLRSYGRALDVDVGPLVGSMSPSLPEADLRPAPTLHQPMPARSMLGFGSGGGGNRVAWLLLIVLGVVALALFFGGESNLSNVRSWLSEFRPAVGDGAAKKSDAPAGIDGTGSTSGPIAPDGAKGATDKGLPSGSTVPRGAAPAGPAPLPQAATSPSVPDAAGASAPKAGDGAAAEAASPAPAAPGKGAPAVPPTPSGAPEAKPAPAASIGATAPVKPVDAKAGAAEAGRRVVKLVFQRESWVEVRGPDGNVLFTGTQQPGTEREFTAGAPVSMIIGNAEFVRAEVDGRPFDLVPHTRAAIARVTLR